MPKELKRIDITHRPELLQIVHQLHNNESVVLQEESQDVAIVRPLKRAAKRGARGGVLTRDDSLFKLIGIGESNIPGGVSGKKHEHLLEGYRQRHS